MSNKLSAREKMLCLKMGLIIGYFIICWTGYFIVGAPVMMTLEQASAAEQVGFLTGWMHGTGIVFSLTMTLFSDATVYAINSEGTHYYLGFGLSIANMFGLSNLSRN